MKFGSASVCALDYHLNLLPDDQASPWNHKQPCRTSGITLELEQPESRISSSLVPIAFNSSSDLGGDLHFQRHHRSYPSSRAQSHSSSAQERSHIQTSQTHLHTSIYHSPNSIQALLAVSTLVTLIWRIGMHYTRICYTLPTSLSLSPDRLHSHRNSPLRAECCLGSWPPSMELPAVLGWG